MADKPKIIVKGTGKPVIVIKPTGTQPAQSKPERRLSDGEKHLIGKCLEIVINDTKRLFGKDRKTQENKMIYKEFMEQHFGRKPE
jgi:hypothetical protein